VIFVFAKTPGDITASLAKNLDEAVAANTDKKLAAVINFTGEQTDEFQKKVGKFAEKNDLQNVLLTVTADAEKFNISDEVNVTVMHYRGKKVKFRFATSTVDDQAIDAIVKGIDSILE
jgi:hypothetical protein